jgi:CRISPR system Cascade subunit CasC
MNMLEFHIIQSFPFTCLNRDDNNAPKEGYFGGTKRARVSSQCWKRAIRLMARELFPEKFSGVRSKFFMVALRESLLEQGMTEERVEEVVLHVTQLVSKIDEKKNKLKTMLYYSNEEVSEIARAAIESEKPLVEKDLNKLLKGKHAHDAADISLFGRMVASAASLNLEGAASFSHALSVHRVETEQDFFTAVDDIIDEENQGSGHLDYAEFNSACYYRYINVNLDLLVQDTHLGILSKDERQKVLEVFIKSCLTAIPQAKKNTLAGPTLPNYVMGIRRKGTPVSLVGAFESPVRGSNGYVEESVKRMKEHKNNLYGTFCFEEGTVAELPEKNINKFCEVLLNV